MKRLKGTAIRISAHAERRAKARLGWDYCKLLEMAFEALQRVVVAENRKGEQVVVCKHRKVDFIFKLGDGDPVLTTVYRKADRRPHEKEEQ